MKSFNKLLIVDDDRDFLLAAQLFLKQHAERVDTETDPNHIPSLLQNELTADPDLVEQVLINLLRNALQALAGRDKARIDLMWHSSTAEVASSSVYATMAPASSKTCRSASSS